MLEYSLHANHILPVCLFEKLYLPTFLNNKIIGTFYVDNVINKIIHLLKRKSVVDTVNLE